MEKSQVLAVPGRDGPFVCSLFVALTACAGLATPAPVQAQAAVPPVQSPAPLPFPPEAWAQGVALVTQAARLLAPAQARVTVQAGTLDPRMVLAPCTRVEAYRPAGTPAWGRTRLGLRCAEGRARWNVMLPVTVQVFAPAVVAAAALPAGVPLTEALLQSADTDWASASSPLFEQPGALLGRRLSRPLAAGQPVPSAQLQERQWFATGDTVRIRAAGAGFAVAGEGQALGPGLEGKTVRIQVANGRVLLGKPVSDRCVEVVL